MAHALDRLAKLSPEKQALLQKLLREKAAPAAGAQPRPAERRGPVPASFAQQRLWFLEQLNPGSPVYHMPSALRVRGELDVDVLERSLNEVVRRHQALRTVFAAADGAPVQVVLERLRVPVARIDLRSLPAERREAEVRRLAEQETLRPFDLERGPLLRASTARLGPEEHAVFFTLHHIVGDAWSMDVLTREVSTLYAAFSRGEPSPLPELELQYADHALWQRERLAGEALEEQLAYWRGQLAGVPPFLDLPTDHPRPATPDGRGADCGLALSPETSRALRALSRREEATPFATLLTAWQALLARWTGQDDLAVGTLVAGRTTTAAESLIGLFVNTLVLRADLSGDPTFREALRRTREAVWGAQAHQDLPFDRLVEALHPERSTARTPLFQVLFALDASEPEGGLRLGGVRFQPLQWGGQTARFDLSLTVRDQGEAISASLVYRQELWEPETVERMLAHLRTLLEAVAADPERRVGDLPLLCAAERAQVLEQWNATALPFAASGDTVHARFAAQAALTPDATAVVADGREVGFAALDRRANGLAHALRARGVGPETRVALLLERSTETLAAILGVLKAGGAFVPLDPAAPAGRLGMLLEDSGAALVLTQEALRPRLPAVGLEVLRLDSAELSAEREDAPVVEVTGRGLAYVIYTSGSTGRPKGVLIEHGSVVNLAEALRDGLYVRRPEGVSARVAMNGPYTFDTSVKQWVQLLWGSTICVVPEEVRADAHALAAWLRETGVEVLDITPAQLRPLLEEGLLAGQPGLTDVLVAGEAIDAGLWQALATDGARRYHNLYGPTECTVDASMALVAGAEPTVGRGIGNVRLYVLDGRGEPVPVGVAGELYVGGAGVGRGYLGRPELTAERFVPDAFSREAGARLYRTGDRVRWRGDGTLEYLGRVDFQVKIRGYRVEPGEVEAVLAGAPGVREAVVVAREDGGAPRLVAYVVGDEGVVEGARAHLRGRLPEYMVPAAFVALDALPLTRHGKTDRRALPAPDARAEDASGAPRTAAQEILAGIWAEVLGRERVGVHDDFFELGGHSLLATRVAARIRRAFDVEVPLRAVFDAPTVAELAGEVEAALRAERGSDAPPLQRAPRSGPLPLSFAQQRLWFLHRLDPASPAYNMAYPLRVRGGLDARALRRALTELVRRHEALRTRFPEVEGGPVQEIVPAGPAALPVVELGGLPAEVREGELRRLAQEEAVRPFDLARGPMLRSTLVRMGGGDDAVLFTLHHVVSDGWSTGILVREVSTLYEAHVSGARVRLPELPVQYADFAVWQRSWLAGETLEAQLSWWRERLAGAPPLLELPTDRPRPAVPDGRGGSVGFAFPTGTAREVRALARREGATLFMTLLAAWQALLSRWSRQDDVVVGTPVAGRTRVELEGLIGFFANTLALRTDLSDDPSFGELLRRVRETTLAAHAHEDLPFERLAEELVADRSLDRTPLFQAMLVVQNAAAGALSLGAARVEPLPVSGGAAKFDLLLGVAEQGDALAGALEFRTELWDASTASRMLGHFARLLAGVVADPSRRPSEVDLLSGAERAEIEGWNATDGAYPPPPVHETFARQAALTPDAVAVESAAGDLTYRELDRASARLARRLRALGVRPETRVGISMERAPEMMVAVLGVLRAGGCYVPLDPAYPAERLAYMVEDSRAPLLLTQARLAGRVPAGGTRTLLLDAEWAEVEAESDVAPESGAGPDDLAYVIYTSGSTGRPKGVALGHGALANLVAWHLDTLLRGARTLQFASLSFDASFHEVFAAWCSGGTVVLITEEEQRDVAAVGRVLEERAIAKAILPVPMLQHLAEAYAGREGRLGSLREVTATGEQLHVTPPMRRLFAALPGCELHNHYGPSETHVVTAHPLAAAPEGWPSHPPIGRPIRNTQIHLLDRHLGQVPPGVPGELFIAGVSLARGYLNRPELTAERFLPDPFAASPGARMYRSGDLARWLPGGEVEYLGRADQQLKIRGFRIEPGEVEAALAEHPRVREAVVVAHEAAPGDRRLVAYLVAAGALPGVRELRAHLAARVPEYMVPAHFVELGALPVTPTGKLDRRALPAPEGAAGTGAEYVAPRTPVEELLAGTWAELLRAERVGAHDSFFELGGHSLLATRVVSRLRGVLGVEVPLRALFEAPTLGAFAERVEAALRAGAGTDAPPVVPVPRDGPLPLSFAQQRLWFVQQLDPAGVAYNMPFAVRVRGSLDVAALERALGEVVRRHEALRTRFPAAGPEPVQEIVPAAPVRLEVDDLSAMDPAAREAELAHRVGTEARTPFDLARDLPLRVRLLRLGAEEWALLCTLHHVAADGWSMAILVREVSEAYRAFAAGGEPALPELPVQYADFAVWQRGWLAGETLERSLGWWRERLAGAPPLLELPTDRPRPAVLDARAGSRAFVLDADASRALRALGRAEGATPYMTLLAGLQALLGRYAGEDDVSVGTPVSGRTRLETEGLIGFFINTLVIRTDLSGDPSFRELQRRVREATLGAYTHQEVPFEKLVEELDPERSLNHTPLFQVSFAFQNNERGELDLGGAALEPLGGGTETARFDLTLAMGDDGERFAGILTFRAELWDDATIERMLGHFRALLESAAAAPDRPVAGVELLSAAERAQLLEEWNDTARDYPTGVCVHELVAAQAARTPDADAVVYGGDRISFAELDRRANRLARHLRVRGAGPDARVGLFLERGPELVVAVLAILKAGAAYVALDPGYPDERLLFVLRDAGVELLVTRSGLAERLAEFGGEVVRGDADADRIAAEADAAPESGADPENLAYVIYTSGSTGTPKGVLVEHRSMVNYLHFFDREVLGDDPFALPLVSRLGFDAHVRQLFPPLLRGRPVWVLPEETVADPSALLEALAGEERASFGGVPSLWSEMLERVRGGDSPAPAGLRAVLLGGEALSPELVERTFAQFPDVRIWNHYGPTEATVNTTVARVERGGRVGIGRPVANARVYLLDARLAPVPAGVPGELYVGGAGVARGYLGRHDLTAERFLPDPFSAEPGARMYRSGDRVRWLADGTLEYAGRTDHQVKVRGFRIEPGEIEAVLERHPEVREAVVVVLPDPAGEPRLVGYVVPQEGEAPAAASLRAHLAERLPEYMVPGSFVALDALPRTPNGKTDRRALPAPEWGAADADAYVPPSTPTEEQVAAAWAEVLKLERVGVHDNFFALGGHSLLATRVVSRLRRELGRDVPLRAVFENPTVAGFAAAVDALDPGGDAAPPTMILGRAEAERMLERIDELSEEQVALLLQVLEGDDA